MTRPAIAPPRVYHRDTAAAAPDETRSLQDAQLWDGAVVQAVVEAVRLSATEGEWEVNGGGEMG